MEGLKQMPQPQREAGTRLVLLLAQNLGVGVTCGAVLEVLGVGGDWEGGDIEGQSCLW